MKKILFLIVALVAATLTFGQRVTEGEIQVNGGLGFGLGGWSVPIYAGVDYGIYPDITVGGIVNFASKTYNYGLYSNTGRWFSLGAKGDYHFNTLLELPDIWDVYAGATLFYNSFSYSNDWEGGYADFDSSGIGFGLQTGGRYYFTDNFAANVEFWGSTFTSGGRIGISYKF